MAVTINGTTGITSPGLSVDSPTLVVDDANNRVGIGVENPAASLDVNGTVNSLYCKSSGGGEFNEQLYLNLNGNTYAEALAIRGGNSGNGGAYVKWMSDAGTTGYTGHYQGITAGTGYDYTIYTETNLGFRVHVNGNSTANSDFYINSSGNVGIGTNNPDRLLHLYDIDGPPLLIDRNSSGTRYAAELRQSDTTDGNEFRLVYQSDTTGVGAQSDVFFASIGFAADTHDQSTRAGSIRFRTSQGGVGNEIERLRITSTGNVGIGTTNPSAKLSVWNGTAAVYNSSTGNAVWNAGTTNGNGLMKVFRSDATVFLRVDSDAKKVGIQTDSPTDTLTVYNSNIGNPTGITIRNTESTSDYSHARLRLESKNGTAYGEIWADVANSSLRTGYNSSATTFLTEQGNLGIGAIPASDINGTYRALKIYNNAYVTGYTSNTYPALHLNVNARPTTSSFSAGFVRDVAGTYTHPMSLEMYAGQLTLRGASTGAADSAITWENRFRIESNGNVSIGNGNLVFSTAGKGIDFSATSDASGATSELLDDYEEGNFTPIVRGRTTAGTTTYNRTAVGKYVKIGRLVNVMIDVQWTSATGTGDIEFGGLPFAAHSGPYVRFAGSVSLLVAGFSWTNQLSPYINDGLSHFWLIDTPKSGSFSFIGINSSNSEILLNCTYMVS